MTIKQYCNYDRIDPNDINCQYFDLPYRTAFAQKVFLALGHLNVNFSQARAFEWHLTIPGAVAYTVTENQNNCSNPRHLCNVLLAPRAAQEMARVGI